MVRGRGVHKQLDQPVKKNLKKLYKFCMVTFGKTFPRHFPTLSLGAFFLNYELYKSYKTVHFIL